jgi:hypothetical protein
MTMLSLIYLLRPVVAFCREISHQYSHNSQNADPDPMLSIKNVSTTKSSVKLLSEAPYNLQLMELKD